MDAMLRISEVAHQTGIATSTIRYYEEIGLIPAAKRGENGYRLYSPSDVERLRFIQRAKALEFSLTEIGEILALRESGDAPCAYVISQIDRKTAEVTRKIAQLNQLKAELTHLQAEISRLPTSKIAAQECVCHLIENENLTNLSELTGAAL